MDGATIATNPRIGRIVAISGCEAVALLDAAAGRDAEGASLQLGSLVKMRTPQSTVFAAVTALNIPLPSTELGSSELQLVELELIGEIVLGQEVTRFRRGISMFPGLGESVLATSQEDLRLVYAAPSVASARIGTIHQDRALPAYVIVDELLGKHLAVLGTTGTGKSCAVALILRTILARHANGHVILLDMHNEYAHAFRDMAELLNRETLELPYWLLTFAEIEEIVLAETRDRDAESPILAEIILAAKRAFAGDARGTRLITIDSPIPYRLSDLERLLEQAAGKLEKGADARHYVRLKTRLNALRADPRYAFLFPPQIARQGMEAILARLFRVPVAGKPITIVDLSSVPSEVLNVVVSVLCRMAFDFAMLSERAMPILLVCEEAHRYCPVTSKAGFEPTIWALSRIAKEGRKYGISLCLVSQRPAELAPAVLSQCNTIFALRMSNGNDQQFVRSALRESATGLLDFLPALRNMEAIVIGEGVSVPMRLCIDDLPEMHRPLSGTASFSTAWQNDVTDPDFLASIAERWRQR